MPSSVYNFYTFQMHTFQMCTWLCLQGAWCFMHNITGTQLLQQWDVQHNLSKHSKQDIRNHLQYLVTVIFGKLLCISNMKKQLMLQGGESQNCYGTSWFITLGVLWFACFFFSSRYCFCICGTSGSSGLPNVLHCCGISHRPQYH